MLTLRVVRAAEGDCLLLCYGTPAKPRWTLVDGGPAGVFDDHLSKTLRSIAKSGGSLERVILSHVDRDHVDGLRDLLSEIKSQRDAERAELIEIDGVWVNEFARTVDVDGTLRPRVASLLSTMGAQGAPLAATGFALEGVKEGNHFVTLAKLLDLPINDDTGGKPFVAKKNAAPIPLGNLKMHVVGPTQANLDELRDAWVAWLDAQEERVGRGDFQAAAMADKSIPNLSSLQLLVVHGKKTLLLTGDGRGDHLLEALAEGGHLDASGTIHVDVLKVPHHGSNRNVTRGFFQRVTADTYVISANGKHDNPDYDTLEWIVGTAQDADRAIVICVTERDCVARFVADHPPAKNGYRLKTIPSNRHYVDLEIA